MDTLPPMPNRSGESARIEAWSRTVGAFMCATELPASMSDRVSAIPPIEIADYSAPSTGAFESATRVAIAALEQDGPLSGMQIHIVDTEQ